MPVLAPIPDAPPPERRDLPRTPPSRRGPKYYDYPLWCEFLLP